MSVKATLCGSEKQSYRVPMLLLQVRKQRPRRLLRKQSQCCRHAVAMVNRGVARKSYTKERNELFELGGLRIVSIVGGRRIL